MIVIDAILFLAYLSLGLTVALTGYVPPRIVLVAAFFFIALAGLLDFLEHFQ